LITLRSKTRFDDVGEMDADGFYEYVYRGYNYQIAAGDDVFGVRIYDDEPHVALINPPNARTHREAKPLVDFIVANLGCSQVKFLAPSGGFRSVDLETLQFLDT
jgi:hypothetical protein